MPCRLYRKLAVGSLGCVITYGTLGADHHAPHVPERPFGHPPGMPTSISSNTGATATWDDATWDGPATWE